MKTTKSQALSLISGAVLGLAGIAGTAQASIVDFEVGANSCYTTVCSGVQGFDFAFVAAASVTTATASKAWPVCNGRCPSS
jgi:ABC-type uncharacterized transport system ATPase subunit